MARILSPLFLALTILSASFSAGMAADISETPSVTVSGTGTSSARPDMANVSLGVVTDGATAREALDLNTAAMSRVIVELKGQKVDPKDIQTTNFSVNPRFQQFQDGKPPAIIGYRVVNSVRIVVRDLNNLGKILDQTVGQGSNQMNGIQFSIDNANELENEARKRAMSDARHKAELFAHAAGSKVGKVLNITEGSTARTPMPVYRRATLEARAAPVPIEAGEQKLEEHVTVTWELKH